MAACTLRILLAAVLIVALASPSFAARRSSLSGNLLIEDADDMFFFPHVVTMHDRMINFDFGTNQGLGSGGLAFGNDRITVGLFAHRSEFLGALPNAFFTRGDIDNIGGNGRVNLGIGPSALNWIDMLVGWQWGTNPWGVRFSVGRNNDDPADDATQEDVTAFSMIAGTRLWNADASVEFALGSATDATAASTTESSPWHLAVGIRRTALEEGDALALGWLGLLSYGSAGFDETPTGGAAVTTDRSQFDLVLGAGPVYKPNDRTNVAMYGTFEYRQSQSEDPSVSTTNTEVVIPGWHVAGEFELARWLQFRAGLRSQFVFVSDKTETSATSGTDKSNRLDYDWTTGLGIHFDNFTVDAFLDPSVITTGTDLFGDSNQLFGMVSTTYHF